MSFGDLYGPSVPRHRLNFGLTEHQPTDCGWDLDTIGPPTQEQLRCFWKKTFHELRDAAYDLIELNDKVNPKNYGGFTEVLDNFMDDITQIEAEGLAEIDGGTIPN
jgi:hypothetical protein